MSGEKYVVLAPVASGTVPGETSDDGDISPSGLVGPDILMIWLKSRKSTG
jgi:hypothetical protein